MSSRILRGVAAEPVVWRRIGVPAEAPGGPACAGPDAETERLRRRIGELERELQEREQRGFAAGYAKGEVAGRQAAAGPTDTAAAKLLEAVAKLGQDKRRLRHEAEEDCVKLAVAVARRVLRRELTMDPEAMLGIVKAAMSRLDAREVQRIRLHPEDVETFRKSARNLVGGAIEIAPDAAMERGSCVIETSRGRLDASIETQLAEIENGLADRIA